MADEGPDRGWSDSSARAVLQLMVESVAQMVGFEVAVLSVILDEELVTVAYTGPEEYREYLLEPDPVAVLDSVLGAAVDWGPRLRFIEAGTHGELEGHWVVMDQQAPATPDAWHPEDALLALLTDDAGTPVGILSVDKPVSGRRPDERQRDLLERYAAQAERAVLTAFERAELLAQVAHAEAARWLIRAASTTSDASVEAVLRLTHRPLVEGFGASGSWIQVFDPGIGYARSHDGETVFIGDEVVEAASRWAPVLWSEQRCLVATVGESEDLSPAVHALLEDLELWSVVGVPLGVGPECVGFLVLTRRAQDPAWSPGEIDSALEVGHDLGAALATARALERERTAVRELQQLDDYRSQLIATLSHELRTPLTVISGNLELLGAHGVDAEAERFHAAMTRGTQRMQKVVDDLLLLARVSHPQHPIVRAPVDLVGVVDDVVQLVGPTARSKGLDLTVELEDGPLVVPGDAAELDRLLANLVSNAVKYTGSGGSVRITARRHGDDVVLRVADTGLGISEEDRTGLFSAFFRTTNPDALSESGTGLGLAIVASITERHAGRVDVASALGEGTTFTVTLPAAWE